jgi:hypothetical protein
MPAWKAQFPRELLCLTPKMVCDDGAVGLTANKIRPAKVTPSR